MSEQLPILDAASAVAASDCHLARSAKNGWTGRHPRPCGWCLYPLADLARMVRGFNDRGWDAQHFRGLPSDIQRANVLAAQAFEPEAAPEADAAGRPDEPSMPPTPPAVPDGEPTPTPAQGPTADEPAWFAADFGGML